MEGKEGITALVEKARSGDQQAWSGLYEKTLRGAFFTAKKMLKTEEDAIDLVHDAYIAAFERLTQLENPKKFEAWLSMIVANKCRDYLKRKKPLLFADVYAEDLQEVEWEDVGFGGMPEQFLEQHETVRMVAEMIEVLPEDQKLCVILYYRNELSVAEIAQALEVSEGTVKSRLNYARKRVKVQVEELEKRGTKLYGMAPIPLLVWLLKTEANAMEIPASIMAWPPVAAVTYTPIAKSAVVGAAGGKTAAAGVAAKVVAGLLTITVVSSSVAAYMMGQSKVEDMEDPKASIECLEKEAYALYEELLSAGNTESGLKIRYYAYVDLDHDKIPELLVADADGTPDSWSTCEVYTYRDSALRCCGTSSAHYDYFYLVNDEYVLGRHRMGPQFISTGKLIKTTVYHWNDEMTRNDPAISYNNGEWEYITKEEFEAYSAMPDEKGSAEGFVKTAEPIKIEKNTLARPDLVEKNLSYTDAWGFLAEMDEEERYHLSMVFEDSGRIYCVLSVVLDGQPVEPLGYYYGFYVPYKDTLSIQLDETNEWIVYRFDSEFFTLTQTSENGIFKSHKPGDIFELKIDAWNDAETIKTLVERFGQRS